MKLLSALVAAIVLFAAWPLIAGVRIVAALVRELWRRHRQRLASRA